MTVRFYQKAVSPNLSIIFCLLLAFSITLSAVRANIQEEKAQGKQEENSPFLNFDREAEIDKLNAEMNACYGQGKFREARNLAEKALSHTKSHYGENHFQYASALSNLAFHEQNRGNYFLARSLFEKSLSLMQSLLGPENPKLVPVLNNLSILLAAQGDPEKAFPLLERALVLEERVLGENCPDLANTLNNLAVIYDAAGRHEDSRKTLWRAYKIQQGESIDELEKALTLSNLSLLVRTEGDLHKAEEFMREALQLRKLKLQNNDADLAESYNNLAQIELMQKKKEDARSHLRAAMEIIESRFSSDHIELVPILNNMAQLDLQESKHEEARTNCLRSSSIIDMHLTNVLPGLSFAEQRSFLNSRLPSQIALLISTSTKESDLRQTYEFLFRWKGLLIDSLKRQSQLNLLSQDKDKGADVLKLMSLRTRLSALFYSAADMSIAERKAKTLELEAEKERLERSLSSTVNKGTISDLLSVISLEEYCALLKPDERLTDIYYYWRSGNSESRPHYAAFFLDGSARVILKDLGDADSLNRTIRSWLQKTAERKETDTEFQILKSRLEPLRELKNFRLFICPDAELNRLPLSLFLENTFIAQLDAPRELSYLRYKGKPQTRDSETSFLAVGGVSFGKEMEKIGFANLPGTLSEVNKLATLAKENGIQAKVLSAMDASKENVLQEMQKSELIHLATHGLFAESDAAPKTYTLESRAAGIRLDNFDTRDPLAKSGLVLAEKPGLENEERQILSAEELINIDLHKCRSVVLSACDTGLGVKENAQGILGLRSAIMAAGARMLVISLWKVPDTATVAFMEEFYKSMWQEHLSAAESLKKAKESLAKRLSEKRTAEWGAWVLIGEGW